MLNFVGYGESFLSYTIENPIQDLFFYFILYSFIGWVIEGCYTVVTEKRFATKSFLNAPLKPMYGFAPIILLECVNPNASIGFIVFLSFIIPSVVELISGIFLKKFFGEKWWDYSNMKFNIKGFICLKFSVYWIALCMILIYIIHPLVYSFYKNIYFIWNNIYLLATIYIIYNIISVIVLKLKTHRKLKTN